MPRPMPDFTLLPIAHRGLHDAGSGVIENSLSALAAAAAAGYGIELDVQLSADGEAMVFHDYALDRLTAETGPVRARTAAALRAAQPEMARGITKGVLHKNTVARKMSRLSARVKALAA